MKRFSSIDIVRGAVMVLMAIDHVRVYSGVPAGGPSPGVFFTRWVTHFCAPAFVFLAGTAAFLHGRKLGDTGALARFLVTRGLLLVLLELTIIRFSWTFHLGYSNFMLAGVIWMLGWCMVLLAALVWLPTWVIGTFGVLVIIGQNAFAGVPQVLPTSLRPAWEMIYAGGSEEPFRFWSGAPPVTVLYTIVPWIGVIAAGYAFGMIVLRPPEERRRLFLWIGLSATALFLILGGLSVWLTPASDGAPPALFRLLNQQKYPASQLFLLMTLGPMMLGLAVAERARGGIAAALEIFGRVPFFYYLLHIPLIHLTALVVWWLRDAGVNGSHFATAPYVSIPPPARWSLWLLYLVFAIDVVILYAACRWFAGVKARSQSPWLRYL